MYSLRRTAMRDAYMQECTKIEDNCTYTAEAHHIIALRNLWQARSFQVLPASIAAILGVLVGTQILEAWWVWLSVVAASIAAVGSTLNPLKEYHEHLHAAKNFTVLKQDVGSLRDTFSHDMDDERLASAVTSLHHRYNEILTIAPPTNPKAFAKAQKRVQSGVHAQDAIPKND